MIGKIPGGLVAMRSASLPWPSSAEPAKTMERLNQDFLEFIGLLAEENVEYLIVGGYAVGIHGFPRYTGDIGERRISSGRWPSKSFAVRPLGLAAQVGIGRAVGPQ